MKPFQVAPFTGAWIEIATSPSQTSSNRQSHPSRVRGLKFFELGNQCRRHYVAPFTGAWIEISCPGAMSCSILGSHPSRVRGLKYLPYAIPLPFD